MHIPGAGAWSSATLTVLMAQALSAQSEVKLDWASGSAADVAEVEAGSSVAFLITNADRVCYSYKVTISQPETADRTVDVGSLLGVATKMPTLAVAGKPDAALSQPVVEDRIAALLFTGQTVDKLVQALTELSALTDSVASSLVRAMGEVAEAYNAAVRAEETALACPSPRPRSVAGAQLRQRWRTTMLPPLAALDQALTHGAADSSAIASSLTALAGKLDALSAEFEGKPELRSQQEGPLNALSIRLKQTLPANQATLGARLAEARSGAAELRTTGDVLQKPIRRVIRVKDTADSLGITVVASTPDASGDSEVVSSDMEWLGVKGGGPLVYFTSGYFVSTLNSPHYEGVLRPVPGEDPPDSTVSTYANRAGDSRASAPFIAANLRVLRAGRLFDLAVSFGTALRSVNGQSKLDVLFGLTGLIGRTIAVSAGLHRGDREYLLLDQAVLDAGTPSTLTRESVVGVETKVAGFLGVTIRLANVGD